ncbi:hypothetical protein ES703_27683 [subsurface metagenome]
MEFSKANVLIRGSYWAQSNLGFCSVPIVAIILISGLIALRIFGVNLWIFFPAGLIFLVLLFLAMGLFLRIADNASSRLELMKKISKIKARWILKERNAEIRKLIIEKIGWAKILSDLEAELVNQWDSYELYRIRPRDQLISESFQLLKMKCPSAGSDYVLCVPPRMNTAEAAIKWVNRGIEPKEFIKQT